MTFNLDHGKKDHSLNRSAATSNRTFAKAERDMAKIEEIVTKLLAETYALMDKSNVRNPPIPHRSDFYEDAFKLSKVKGWKSFSELRSFLDSRYKWVVIPCSQELRPSVLPFIYYLIGDEEGFSRVANKPKSKWESEYFSFRTVNASDVKKRVPRGSIRWNSYLDKVAFRDDILPIVLIEAQKFPEWKNDVADRVKREVYGEKFRTENDLRIDKINSIPSEHK